MKKNRNYGIDLLRIISMIMIVILHILSQGGILNNVPAFGLSYQLAWALEIICYMGVNIYALISGYVGIDSKFKYTNIIKLTLEVMFYTVLITLIFKIIDPSLVSTSDIVKSFFPFAFNHYWYFTAYFGIFFFIPFIQKMVGSFDRNDSKKFIWTVIIIFSLLPIIFREDIFFIKWGYHVVWLSCLYIVGACIKKFGFNNVIEKNLVKVLLISVLVTIISKIAIEYAVKIIVDKEIIGMMFVSYTSPTVLLSSISTLLIFSKMEINDRFKKCISFLAPLSFAVYLIHTEPLIWERLLKDAFKVFTTYNPILMILIVLSSAILIYMVCIIIEYVRVLLFKLLKVDKFTLKVDKN